MVLTAQQLSDLHRLALKLSGEDVPFINIANAQALTELGLAVRSREGWRITALGSATLGEHLARMGPSASITPDEPAAPAAQADAANDDFNPH